MRAMRTHATMANTGEIRLVGVSAANGMVPTTRSASVIPLARPTTHGAAANARPPTMPTTRMSAEPAPNAMSTSKAPSRLTNAHVHRAPSSDVTRSALSASPR